MANIHKDFHGAMSYGLQYLSERYGKAETVAYLKQLAHTLYSPLVEALKTEGLPALYKHWNYIFTIEDADFEIGYEENDVLFLKVKKCPAIHHMREKNYQVAEKYCQHCRIINEEICHSAGYKCSIEYNQDKGSCIQKFWENNNNNNNNKVREGQDDFLH